MDPGVICGENNYAEFFDLPSYLRNLISEKNIVGKEYQDTTDERKLIEFQLMNKAIIAELRALRAADLSIRGRSPDLLSKYIADTISESAKIRLRFQTTRVPSFRRRFEGGKNAIKKLINAHGRKVMDIERRSRELERNTQWANPTEAGWTWCDSVPEVQINPHPPLNESQSCDENDVLSLFGPGGVFV
ncbi:hypothetical protein JTB14_030627 [Gonioctena quinquepunctata]|nr:hypothetical protein JTB14_030627 [Gonioctena quinquepunctata]